MKWRRMIQWRAIRGSLVLIPLCTVGKRIESVELLSEWRDVESDLTEEEKRSPVKPKTEELKEK